MGCCLSHTNSEQPISVVTADAATVVPSGDDFPENNATASGSEDAVSAGGEEEHSEVESDSTDDEVRSVSRYHVGLINVKCAWAEFRRKQYERALNSFEYVMTFHLLFL